MPELRWILLIAGLVLLVGIYVYGRINARKTAAPHRARVEPSLTPDLEPRSSPGPATEIETDRQTAAPVAAAGQEDLPLASQPVAEPPRLNGSGEKEKIVTIRVAAKSGRRFRGVDLSAAFEAENLQFGEFGIFHRYTGNRTIFSVTSMVEPGTFDPENMEVFSTPGINMFMIIPGPESPVGVFTEMLSTARRMATMLDGEVLDESGSTLSRQAASHLREQIIEFAHRVR